MIGVVRIFFRLDYIFFLLWILATLIAYISQPQPITLALTIGSIASFVAYIYRNPISKIKIEDFIYKSDVDRDITLLPKYVSILGSEKGENYFADTECSNKIINKFFIIFSKYEYLKYDDITKIMTLLYCNWSKLEMYLQSLSLEKRWEKINSLLEVFGHLLNDFDRLFEVNNSHVLKFMEDVLLYINTNLADLRNNDLFIYIKYSRGLLILVLNLINKLLSYSKNFSNIEEYRTSNFKNTLNIYIYILNSTYYSEKIYRNSQEISEDDSISKFFQESKDIINKIENKYKKELESKNESDRLIARDILSYIYVIKEALNKQELLARSQEG